MRNVEDIRLISRGCRTATSLLLAQKCIWRGTVRVALNNTKLHNMKFVLAIECYC